MVVLDNLKNLKPSGWLEMAGIHSVTVVLRILKWIHPILPFCLLALNAFCTQYNSNDFLYLLLAESRWSLAVMLIFFHFHVKAIKNMKQNIFYKTRTRKRLHRKILRTQTLLFKWLNPNSYASLPERSVTTYLKSFGITGSILDGRPGGMILLEKAAWKLIQLHCLIGSPNLIQTD